jgi:quercetin dioxygenase-like cupin family protein
MRATEDGDLEYLYIKDKTWTVVGLAEDEAIPGKAMTVREANDRYRVGERDKHRKAPGASQAIVDGLHDCFYAVADSLEAPRCSARRVSWIEGERLAFGYFDVPSGYDEPALEAAREMFVYVVSGTLDAEAGGERKRIGPGEIVYVPRGERYRIGVDSAFARYALVCSTPYLEQRIDSMSAEEAEQARLNMKPN